MNIFVHRYNDFQNDIEAQVEGCNNPIPAGSVANRLDLTLPGSECEFEDLDQMIGHKGYGALDMKFVTRRLMAAGQQFWAVAGPMHNHQVINNILLVFIADYGSNKVNYYYYYY